MEREMREEREGNKRGWEMVAEQVAGMVRRGEEKREVEMEGMRKVVAE